MPDNKPDIEQILERSAFAPSADFKERLRGRLADTPDKEHDSSPNGYHTQRRPQPPRQPAPAWMGMALAAGMSLVLIIVGVLLSQAPSAATSSTPTATAEPTATAVVGEHTPAPVDIDGTLVWRNLTIAESEAAVGFDVWVPTELSEEWRFNGAKADTNTCLVMQIYRSDLSSEFIRTRQSCRDQPLTLLEGEPINVGEHAGIYALRSEDALGRSLTLQWQQNGYTFSIYYAGPGALIQPENLAELATSFEPTP